ncbi:hypothetical protein KQX54_002452 [Cotesia glomerata]|uniref:Uncharacterized protein n=1 Tax=Cotesia glomerata TaxID=32391 RepID=A0AAV7I6E1_COTGL|nr:hypothetical protein KQX54_002452 [Cotesia glomerata]
MPQHVSSSQTKDSSSLQCVYISAAESLMLLNLVSFPAELSREEISTSKLTEHISLPAGTPSADTALIWLLVVSLDGRMVRWQV